MRKTFWIGLMLGVAAPLVAAIPLPQSPIASPHQRLLPLQGGQNFRDLGGYETGNGRHVRWGLLYRSGSMHFLTDADHAYLARLGIRTVCDFRTQHERDAEPAVWPEGAKPAIFAEDYEIAPTMAGKDPPKMPPTAEAARGALIARYPLMLDQFSGQYKRMFTELLAGHAPLAFNCTAGKDRTGIAAALLLTALGVLRATVVEDYALTDRYLDASRVTNGQHQGPVAWKDLPPGVVHAYMTADPAYIEAALAVLDRHPGGAEGWLRDTLGLSHADLLELRRLYTA